MDPYAKSIDRVLGIYKFTANDLSQSDPSINVIYLPYVACVPISVDESKICVIIECRKSSGYGDVLHGLKTLQILETYLPRVKTVIATNRKTAMIIHNLVSVQRRQIHFIDLDVQSILNLKKNYPFTIMITVALKTELGDNDIVSLKDNGIHNIFIDEYCGWRSDSYSPINIKLTPGLTHADGIHITPSDTGSLRDIQFIATTTGEPGIHKDYHLVYLSSVGDPMIDCWMYLETYLKMLNIYLSNKHKNIVLICNRYESIKSTLDKYLDDIPSVFGKCNIIYYDKLPHKTMVSLIKHSNSPVLITGDQSLAEAISFDKLFLYQPHPWKAKLIESYRNFVYRNLSGNSIGSHLLMSFVTLSTLDKPTFDNASISMGNILRSYNDEVLGEHRKICEQIRKYYNIEDRLIGMIKYQYLKTYQRAVDPIDTFVCQYNRENEDRNHKRLREIYDTLSYQKPTIKRVRHQK